MKQIIEYLPIIIFTITYFYTRDIFFATLILLIGLFIQVCLEYLLEKKVSKKTKIIFGISLLFGGSTLFFRNEEFLFWRPTVINWIFSVLLLSVEFFSGKNLLKMIMGKTIYYQIMFGKNYLVVGLWDFYFRSFKYNNCLQFHP